MTVQFLKSERTTRTDTNGGRAGYDAVVYGAMGNILPHVDSAARVAGFGDESGNPARYVKVFLGNRFDDGRALYAVTAGITHPSTAGDRATVGTGTEYDTQVQMLTDPPLWTGSGKLATALSGGESSVEITMEADDIEFQPGGMLYLSNRYKTGQTIAASVKVGDSVTLSSGTWIARIPADDLTYPLGIYVGGNVVMTVESGTVSEFVNLPDAPEEDELLGTGNGTTTPTLSDLANASAGLIRGRGYRPVITAICGGVEREVEIGPDGTASGYCTAGEMDLADGTWTEAIIWTTAPDNGTDITATYYERFWAWSGLDVTVTLDGTVAGAYATANTYASGCLYVDTVAATVSTPVISSAAGTFAHSTYPIAPDNEGTVADTWTITFSSSSAFSCAGLYEGGVGTGTISGNFQPLNPETGEPFFTLDYRAWGGAWSAGNTLTITTAPPNVPLWLRHECPAGTTADAANFMHLEATYQ